MKKITLLIGIIFLSTAVFSFADKPTATPPGKADNFYRGVTTVLVSSTTETVTTTTVLSSVTETRLIGNGQGNGRNQTNDNNAQDRTVTTVLTTVTEVTTNVYDQHHGAPNSRGAYIGTITQVTERVISSETTTVTGDWGPAYSLPSNIR